MKSSSGSGYRILAVAVFVLLVNPVTSSANDGSLKLVAERIDGYCHVLAMSGNTLFAQRGPNIEILDASGAIPELLATIQASPPLVDLEVAGGYLFAAGEDGEIWIFDISDPAVPATVSGGYIDIGETINKIILDGNKLYVGGAGGLDVYDVGNPANPDSLGRLGIYCSDVTVNGAAAYVADALSQSRNVMWIVDVSNPASMSATWTETTHSIEQVEYDAASDQLITAGTFFADQYSGITLFDCANPLSPAPTDTLDLPTLYVNWDNHEWLAVSGSYVYFAPPLGTLHTLDLTTETTSIQSPPTDIQDVIAAGSKLLTSANRSGYSILDLATPSSPTVEFTSDHGGTVNDIETRGVTAYVAQAGGLYVMDAPSPATGLVPRVLVKSSQELIDVAVDGIRAYCLGEDLGGSDDVFVYDISNADAPFLLGESTIGEAQKLEVVDNVLYSLSSPNVFSFDVTDPSAPSIVGLFLSTGPTLDFVTNGDILVLADGQTGLSIFDADAPELQKPVLSNLGSGVQSLALHANKLFAGTVTGEVNAISISDPENPQVVSNAVPPSPLVKMTVSGDLLYGIDDNGDIHVIDISDFSAIELVHTEPTDDPVNAIAAVNGHLLATTDAATMQAYRWTGTGGIVWANIGPGGGGAFSTIRRHPSLPHVIFAGSDVGGIVRSVDSGRHWETKNAALTRPDSRTRGEAVTDFVFSDTDANSVFAVTLDGVFQSDDLGDSFERLFPNEANKDDSNYWGIGRLFIDPGNPNQQWASWGWPMGLDSRIPEDKGRRVGANPRKYISATDDKWATHSIEYFYNPPDISNPVEVTVHSFVKIPSDEKLASTSGGLYKRDDITKVWYQQTPAWPSPGPPAYAGLRDMVLVGNTLYVVVESCVDDPNPNCTECGSCGILDTDWYGGVYKSDDYGMNWEEVNGTEDPTNLVPNPDFEQAGDPALGWTRGLPTGTTATIERTGAGGGHGQPSSVAVEWVIPDGGLEEGGYSLWSESIDVTPGEVLTARAFVIFDDSEPTDPLYPLAGKYAVKISMFWPDLDGTDKRFTTLRSIDTAHAFSTWEQYETSVVVPSEANSVRYVISVYNRGITFRVDDVELVRSQTLPRITSKGEKVEYYRLDYDHEDNALYLGTYRGTSSLGGLWRSIDDGGHWTYLMANGGVSGIPRGLNNENESWCVDVWHGDGAEDPLVSFSNDWLYQSIDGGASWNNIASDSLEENYYLPRGEIHPIFASDVAELPAHPGVVFFGSADFGMYASEDYGESWWQLGPDPYGELSPDDYLQTWDFGEDEQADVAHSFVVDPADPSRIFFGVWHITAFHTPHTTIPGGGVATGTYDPSIGWRFSELGTDSPTGGTFGLMLDDTVNPRVFYVAVTGKGVYRYPEGGSWKVMIDDDDGTTGDECTTDVLPTGMLANDILRDDDAGKIYVDFGHREDYSDTTSERGIWVKDDASNEFRRMKDELNNPILANLVPMDMALDPHPPTSGTPRRLLVAFAVANLGDPVRDPNGTPISLNGECLIQSDNPDWPGGLYLLTHVSGDQWSPTRLLVQPRVTSVLVDPSTPDRLYAFSSASNVPKDQLAGVYVSEDFGETWCRLPGDGMHSLRGGWVGRSKAQPATLYTATQGAGAYRGKILSPQAPTNLAATLNAGVVSLDWTPPENGAYGNYVLQRSPGTSEWTVIDKLGYANSYPDYPIEPGCGYDFAVQAFNEAGASSISNVVTVGPVGPSIASIDPDEGPALGGTVVTIYGIGFVPGATVSFGGVAATGVTVIDCGTIQCTTERHAVGYVDVRVTNPGGATDVLPGAFRYFKPKIGGPPGDRE